MKYPSLSRELAVRWGLTMTEANKWLVAFGQGKEKELVPSGDLLDYVEICTGYPATLDKCKELIRKLRKR